MSAINDGGPAFPRTQFTTAEGDRIGPDGMSLRDWFAGQALASPALFMDGGGRFPPEKTARLAYQTADAMLQQREHGNG